MRSEQFQVHVQMEEGHWWFLGRWIIMAKLAHLMLPSSTTCTVVDIGCGTGGNIASLATDYTCIGIDPSPEAIECAKKRFPKVDFACASTPEEQAERVGKARLVSLMDVLEHMPDDCQFLSRLVDAMRPGAYLIVTVPAGNALWSEHDVSFRHYRRYEVEQFAGLWADLPVKARLVSYFNSRHYYPIIRAIRATNRVLGRTSCIGGTDFRIPLRPANELLKSILGGEADALVDLARGNRRKGHSRGASLLALLERQP